MKVCNTCKIEKDSAEFSSGRVVQGTLLGSCKACVKEQSLTYFRSKFGLPSRIYSNQKTNSKRRGHSLPTYTLKELREWMYSQPNYFTLHDAWVSSNFKRGLSPSCDRLDDSVGYTLDNLRLVSWAINKDKGHDSIRKNSISNATLLQGGHRSVIKLTLDGIILREYISVSEAARDTPTVYQSNISKVCTGKMSQSGGFKWQYKE